MEEFHSLYPQHLVYKCEITNNYRYKLIVVHIFPDVDMQIEKLSYYITVNGDKVFYDETDTCAVYRPELISTKTRADDSLYVSEYNIKSINKLTQNTSDEVKINLLLPFDHESNIVSLVMYKIKTE